MYTDICADYCVFGGGADGVFGDAVLCVGVFYLCGVNDIDIWVFIVVITNGAGGGECAGALSDASSKCSLGADDGAESEIYFAISGTHIGACRGVGSDNAAVDTI